MKITVNLSPMEIQKLAKVTNADFKDCWCTLTHTTDDIAFAIHRLISIAQVYYDDCDGDCENCEFGDCDHSQDNDNIYTN